MDSLLLDDNPHWVDKTAYNQYVPREALTKANAFLDAKEVLAIIGARRVGKSTLAKLMIKELLKNVKAKNIFFINLGKPLFIPFKHDASYLDTIYESYVKLAEPDLGENVYFFIDEIQTFENWEVFVKSKYESSNIKFVITGSNSSLLTSNYATQLTGRVLKLRLHSFNFREFLRYKNIDFSSKISITKNKLAIEKAQEEYMKWGGYFSVISNNDTHVKAEVLKNIAEDIILKDIVPRYKIKNASLIKDLFYYAVSNAGSLMNYSSLAKKLHIDAKTVKEYIGYFEDNFLVTLVSKHHNKLTQTIHASKKLYINDNGFLNLGVTPNRNLGSRLENLVFTVLNEQNGKVCYLREEKEIDFLYNNTLVQVSYTLEDEKTKKRELKAFESFSMDTTQAKYIVTKETTDQIGDVNIITFYKFVLALL